MDAVGKEGVPDFPVDRGDSVEKLFGAVEKLATVGQLDTFVNWSNVEEGLYELRTVFEAGKFRSGAEKRGASVSFIFGEACEGDAGWDRGDGCKVFSEGT